jgi:hypothetical protein
MEIVRVLVENGVGIRPNDVIGVRINYRNSGQTTAKTPPPRGATSAAIPDKSAVSW